VAVLVDAAAKKRCLISIKVPEIGTIVNNLTKNYGRLSFLNAAAEKNLQSRLQDRAHPRPKRGR